MPAAGALMDLTRILRRLHKALVEVTRQKHEAEWGPVDTAELLQLLTRHPDFMWLHELSAFMAEVDALRDKADLTAGDARAAYARARALFWPPESAAAAFAANYRAMLQTAPGLVMEHAALKLLLDK